MISWTKIRTLQGCAASWMRRALLPIWVRRAFHRHSMTAGFYRHVEKELPCYTGFKVNCKSAADNLAFKPIGLRSYAGGSQWPESRLKILQKKSAWPALFKTRSQATFNTSTIVFDCMQPTPRRGLAHAPLERRFAAAINDVTLTSIRQVTSATLARAFPCALFARLGANV